MSSYDLDANVYYHVPVVTYNILSPALVSKEYFPTCKEEHLTDRFDAIKRMLHDSVKSGAIICLQEVPRAWSGPFNVWFMRCGYHYIDSLYGYDKNGYMGVAMAFPVDRFDMMDCVIESIADHIKTPPTYQKNMQLSMKAPEHNFLTKLLLLFALYCVVIPWNMVRSYSERPKPDVYRRAKRYSNTMIALTLKPKLAHNDHTFIVATYHMPCAFYDPQIITLHTMALLERLQGMQKINSDTHRPIPLIIAGDFNFMPDSLQYELIVGLGPIEHDHPAYPRTPTGVAFPVIRTRTMDSAYARTHFCEPLFTNHSQVAGRPVFKDTIDYIFCSKDCGVIAAHAHFSEHDVANVMPNAFQPSDHVMLSATIELTYPSQ